jgi:hypothetical protein
VVTRKLRVVVNIAIAPTLPTADGIGANGRMARRRAMRISVVPISLEAPFTFVRTYNQRTSGLLPSNGRRALASAAVNLKAPYHNRKTTNP